MILDDPPPPPGRFPPSLNGKHYSGSYGSEQSYGGRAYQPLAMDDGDAWPQQGPRDDWVANCWHAGMARRNRFKVLALLGGVTVLVVLHAQLSKPWHPGGPPGHHRRPPWEQGQQSSSLDSTVSVTTSETAAVTSLPPDSVTQARVPPGLDAVTTSTTAEIPIETRASDFVPPRLVPSSSDPWAHLNGDGPETLLNKATVENQRDPAEQPPPPADYMLRVWAYFVKTAKENASRVGIDGVTWDTLTGKPNMVDRSEIYNGVRDGWKKPAVKFGSTSFGEEGIAPDSSNEHNLMDDGPQEDRPQEPEDAPRVQFDPKKQTSSPRALREEGERREWVKKAFLHVWAGYKQHAWGHDELTPLTNSFSNPYNGWGASIIDNLDTLLLLNLTHEYNIARKHVHALDFSFLVPRSPRAVERTVPKLKELFTDEEWEELSEDEREPILAADQETPGLARPLVSAVKSPTTIPTFETIIRYLGGLISAYDLSGDPLMLARAKELGDWLLPALGTRHAFLIGHYSIGSNPRGRGAGQSVLAEVGSAELEFTRLSMITGDDTYFMAVHRTIDTLDKLFPTADSTSENAPALKRLGTLFPMRLDPARPTFLVGDVTMGGMTDSYYEYLIKQAQLTKGVLPQYGRMYEDAIESAYEYLIRPITTIPGHEDDLMTIGSMRRGRYQHEMEHLTCFAGGMLGLGSRLLSRAKDLLTGQKVTKTCVWMYEASASGVGSESMSFYEENEPGRWQNVIGADGNRVRRPAGLPVGVRGRDARYIGRPETIESVFYMYRLTGDRKWQDHGWTMFTTWMEKSITPTGFASLHNSHIAQPSRFDNMESFVMAETLKYYYLLFSPPDLISLDDFVFNTEAHPFRIPRSKSAPRLVPLWNGPDPDIPVDSFASTVGEGTPLQLWARLHQASALMHQKPNLRTPPPPPPRPAFIRPPEEAIIAAQNQAHRVAGAAVDGVAGEGGGRGMGGGPPF